MKKILFLASLAVLTTACQKKPDPPAPVASAPAVTPGQPPVVTPPAPVTSCQNATIAWSLTPAGQTVNDNSSKDFVIPGFNLGCGDTISVFFRTPAVGPNPAPAWTTASDVNNGATYYSLLNQTVTFHNKTGVILEIDIEAVLK